MTDEQFDEYLKDRYNEQINYYDSKAGRNKRIYIWFQWSVIIVSSLLPVLVVSINDSINEKYKLVAAGLSIVLAIGTSALKVFKFQENCLNYRQLAEALKQEEHFYDAEIGAYANAAGQARDICRSRRVVDLARERDLDQRASAKGRTRQ